MASLTGLSLKGQPTCCFWRQVNMFCCCCCYFNSSRSTFIVKFLHRFLWSCVHKECWGLCASMSCILSVYDSVWCWGLWETILIPIHTLIEMYRLSHWSPWHLCLDIFIILASESILRIPGSQKIVCQNKVETWIHSCHAKLPWLSLKFI